MFALRPVQVEYRIHLPYLFGQLSVVNISGSYACKGISSCLTHSFNFVDAKSKLLEASLLINPSVYSFQNFEYLRYDPGNWKYLLDQIDRNQHWNKNMYVSKTYLLQSHSIFFSGDHSAILHNLFHNSYEVHKKFL